MSPYDFLSYLNFAAAPDDSEDILMFKATNTFLGYWTALYQTKAVSDDYIIEITCNAIRLGMMVEGVLSEKSRSVAAAFLESMFSRSDELIDRYICEPENEGCYQYVEHLFQIHPNLGVRYSDLIVCFAYIAGKRVDGISKRLAEIAAAYT